MKNHINQIVRFATPLALGAAVLVAVVLGSPAQSQGAELLTTDFDNGGVSGGDMVDVVWTEDGLTAPTTLGASADVRSGLSGDGDAEGGYFSPNANVNGSLEGTPAWTATWTITVGAKDVELTDVVLASAESNSSASLGSGSGTSNINLTISGTGIDVTQQRTDESGASQELTFTTPVTLTAGADYDVTFTVWEGSSQGHFESFDALTFNGTVIPEPASLALLGLGGRLVAGRQRSK